MNLEREYIGGVCHRLFLLHSTKVPSVNFRIHFLTA